MTHLGQVLTCHHTQLSRQELGEGCEGGGGWGGEGGGLYMFIHVLESEMQLNYM